MKFVRAHHVSLARLLAGLILLGALACSVGHGQMLAALAPAATAEICGPDGATSHMHAGHGMGQGEHGVLMQLAQFDCAYASKLIMGLAGFVALGWLLRVLRRRALLPESPVWRPARHSSPGCAAQAP
ncbi:hypothetical protein RRX38_02350 [Pseudomonas sp. DTU_2021_1001937_2_SI_NGA_ILE_001]|uniref:DUF2946 family protein n=1 Tax=Pseudomonas sp. DTU_2021_1001937_2_SI_NGA_ILE_001 TaxID=3077589 RepID=UPI0028FC0A76|nr:DUF2946 family protein [Pseudomonas sp. DTU_2021_1001937_2_SI_NGA_ILE_001]WNW10037.1 hypothetical protein RRX38_02350 [Pseudomonas sp. DTU_2021_1001937_2_SI_NGA_ILE_001]